MYSKYSHKYKSDIITIFAGEYYTSNKREVISTVLGSCISVCLFDTKKGIGGMNHFMLPTGSGNNFVNKSSGLQKEKLTENSLRYGITSMEVLIAQMQKKGAKRENLQAKIFGGGRVITLKSTAPSIGEKNINFARAFLHTEGISIESEDVGDNAGRKIFYLQGENSVFVKRIPITDAIEEEEKYIYKLEQLKEKMDVTFF